MTNAISLESLQVLISHNLPVVHRPRLLDAACVLGTLCAILKVSQVIRRRSKRTALRGPPNPSLLWGVEKEVRRCLDPGELYEEWTEEYGRVYEVPMLLGEKRLVLSDPKAIAHFYGNWGSRYVLPPAFKVALEHLFGIGLPTAIGENHRRLRRSLTPAFSNAAVRNLTSVFYDSAYKAKTVWDSLIESNGGGSVVINVQDCMKRLTLDTIGLAGFSHNFGSLDGKLHPVTEVLGALDDIHDDDNIFFPLAMLMPWLVKLPSPYTKLVKKLNNAMGDVVGELLTKSLKEKEAGTLGQRELESILGLLIKAEARESRVRLTHEEVTTQAKFLLLAGFDTLSMAFAWTLIELSRNPDVQTKLRAELLAFGVDPTYDQISNSLPYLDGVVHEALRMHPAQVITLRMTAEDDVIPLSKPVRTRSGGLVDHISVEKGTHVLVPISSMNRSTALWGADAKKFKPERWFAEDGIPAGAKELQGHRHLLTFIDGPKICPGKGFAIAELKIVTSILVKNFVFEFVDGPKTEIARARGMAPGRPKVAGQEGDAIPLRVRRYE